jgi:carboxylate-amine ligase
MGVPLVQPTDLSVRDGRLLRHVGTSTRPVDVVYARIDEDMFLSSNGHDGAPLRARLLEALADGNVTIANALGNGVADDKAVYAYVPAMIDYYLGEKPLLPQVSTWVCAERDQRDYVLGHLAELVVKPIDGLGGSGVLIGPEASEAALEERRRELTLQPEHVPAPCRLARICASAPGSRRVSVGAGGAGRIDTGGEQGIADRQFVGRRRQ